MKAYEFGFYFNSVSCLVTQIPKKDFPNIYEAFREAYSRIKEKCHEFGYTKEEFEAMTGWECEVVDIDEKDCY